MDLEEKIRHVPNDLKPPVRLTHQNLNVPKEQLEVEWYKPLQQMAMAYHGKKPDEAEQAVINDFLDLYGWMRENTNTSAEESIHISVVGTAKQYRNPEYKQGQMHFPFEKYTPGGNT